MLFAELSYQIFEKATACYHVTDNTEVEAENPYEYGSIEYYLFQKNWIDAVQWHLEDIVRDPDIEPGYALQIKRRIDESNQWRTDVVELIDDYFWDRFKEVKILPHATINTESPAWALDRLSILCLKIYHMEQEVRRVNVTQEHVRKCEMKLYVLLEQKHDLIVAINQFLEDIEAGRKYMRVYKQMKMYNDPNLNPVLYRKEKLGCQ
ncbi:MULTISPECIES: DUF4254 domain-containing protein [Butyricimonas]|uniref:DUF4254 domain-containing protein n=1 Tax=Butyricimonas TaxID=574697 RepID=UPI000475FD11|nr:MULTISPECIES: DUF4254 domain-containing protein [Butyricimonas]